MAKCKRSTVFLLNAHCTRVADYMEEGVGFHHLGLDDRLLKVSRCVHYYPITDIASYMEGFEYVIPIL